MQIFVKTGKQPLTFACTMTFTQHVESRHRAGDTAATFQPRSGWGAAGGWLTVLAPLLLLPAGQTHVFEVGAATTVADVKELVQAREGELSCSSSRTAAVGGEYNRA